MNIRSGLDTLAQITQTPAATGTTDSKGSVPRATEAQPGERAQLSAAVAQLAHASAASDIRLDKVASIESAIAAGTYDVPASEVAQKVIHALLVPNPSANK